MLIGPMLNLALYYLLATRLRGFDLDELKYFAHLSNDEIKNFEAYYQQRMNSMQMQTYNQNVQAMQRPGSVAENHGYYTMDNNMQFSHVNAMPSP